MLDSNKRAKLRAMATKINPIFQIGKSGINQNQINDISNALELHELIKISVLRNSENTAKEIIDILAKKLGAEPITAIGSKIVLYKRSSREDIEHIEI